MDTQAFYSWVVGCAENCAANYDTHVVGSILAIAVSESAIWSTPVWHGLGIEREELAGLFAAALPRGLGLLDSFGFDVPREIPEDEVILRQLLSRYSTSRNDVEMWLSGLIARRAMQPNHLWQDLGLRSRRELSWLMQDHFAPLAERNSSDMKWKKFLYRMICRDDGYRLCTAPSCSECDDFQICFGDESGESLMAVSRRAADLHQLAAV